MDVLWTILVCVRQEWYSLYYVISIFFSEGRYLVPLLNTCIYCLYIWACSGLGQNKPYQFIVSNTFGGCSNLEGSYGGKSVPRNNVYPSIAST